MMMMMMACHETQFRSHMNSKYPSVPCCRVLKVKNIGLGMVTQSEYLGYSGTGPPRC